MARAHTIWVPLNSNKQPISAFTVKHECKSWLNTDDASSVEWVASLRDGYKSYNEAIPVWDVESFLES